MFFVIGPLRTGSSLLTRCLDDHPNLLAFCESEINRALFSPYFVRLHHLRMLHHGMTPLEIVDLLDRKSQNDVNAVFRWYFEATSLLSERLEKTDITMVGDKSPDYFMQPELVKRITSEHKLIYSIRDPRAIYRSIVMHEGSTEKEKQERWSSLGFNFRTWRDVLENDNLIAVRYEDLVDRPSETMSGVYKHLELADSQRFLEPFERKFPSRFLWKTAVDWESGIRKQFDAKRVDSWRSDLNQEQLEFVKRDPVASEIMSRFDYEW